MHTLPSRASTHCLQFHRLSLSQRTNLPVVLQVLLCLLCLFIKLSARTQTSFIQSQRGKDATVPSVLYHLSLYLGMLHGLIKLGSLSTLHHLPLPNCLAYMKHLTGFLVEAPNRKEFFAWLLLCEVTPAWLWPRCHQNFLSSSLSPISSLSAWRVPGGL